MASIEYSEPGPAIALITINRPEKRNAQDAALLYGLNDAFNRAVQDSNIKVIVLAANGPHFSSGHDLRQSYDELSTAVKERNLGLSGWSDFTTAGAAGVYATEHELYLQTARRWRNLPKPTIALVQGRCVAAGLILAWICDIIIAADDAMFSDPVLEFGVLGVEWFAHPWELGARKAKEFLFSASEWTAQEAHRLGMVNHVVPLDELGSYGLDLANRIATKPMFALRMAKEAVNRSLDIQGQSTAIDAAFSLHQLCHAAQWPNSWPESGTSKPLKPTSGR